MPGAVRASSLVKGIPCAVQHCPQRELQKELMSKRRILSWLPEGLLRLLSPEETSVLAKSERRSDRRGLLASDPGHEPVLRSSLNWLCQAQEYSASKDGGVARDYSLIHGWSSSYPETTGYIIPTFLLCAERTRDSEILEQRARRMLDWLVSIQMPSGAFQGGKIDSTPVVPVTFNTGQILLGLVAGQKSFGEYEQPLQRAADWLVQTQDPDGCWRKFPTPFAIGGEKTYETHVAWGLLEAARLYPNRGYGEAALSNVQWALRHQQDNGWMDKCCLSDMSRPLTHTLGYALRGIIEAARYGSDRTLVSAARKTADGLMSVLQDDGFLPGRLTADWEPAAKWACLTGIVQIAHCWLLLYEMTGEERYFKAGQVANEYVRRTVSLSGSEDVSGGVKGSFPVDGDYNPYRYLSWAAKFLIDSLILELKFSAQRDAAT